ncbi:hypothetical protein KJM57_002251 [Salmonella enterica]|nr:hypothetical protein [Salmonella enterica]
MTTLDPRQLWRRRARTGKPEACKTMHLLHALSADEYFFDLLVNKFTHII